MSEQQEAAAAAHKKRLCDEMLARLPPGPLRGHDYVNCPKLNRPETEQLEELSTWDNLMPRIRHGTALMFDIKPGTDYRRIFEAVATSGPDTLEHMPLWCSEPVQMDTLGKKINARLTKDTKLRIYYRVYDDDPVHRNLYTELKAKNFPLNDFSDTVLHRPPVGDDEVDTWMHLQFNFFPEGVIIAFTAFHVGIDLITEAISLAKWSESTAAAYEGALGPVDMLPADCYDRSQLSRGNENVTLADIPGHGAFNVFEMPPPDETRHAGVIFLLTAKTQQRLKIAASSADPKMWISTADAIEAFVWRHIVRARDRCRKDAAPKTSKILSGVNLRSRLAQPVPLEYVGACTAMAPMVADRQLLHSRDPSALNKLAYTVRTTLSSWDSATYVNNVAGWMNKSKLEEVTWWEDPGELMFTDHSAFPAYVMDWGPDLGQPICWREPYMSRVPPKGEVMVLPKKLDGSSEIMATLEFDAMRALLSDSEFRDYAEIVCVCEPGDAGNLNPLSPARL